MRIAGVLLSFVGLIPAGLAPAERMLCIHRDGGIFVEDYQPSCCKTSCAEGGEECDSESCDETPPSSDCPDDQCRDIPLAVTASLYRPHRPEGLTTTAVAGTELLPTSPEAPFTPIAPEIRPAFNILIPPTARPETLLRTVILRL